MRQEKCPATFKVKLAIDAVKKYADGPGIPKKEK